MSSMRLSIRNPRRSTNVLLPPEQSELTKAILSNKPDAVRKLLEARAAAVAAYATTTTTTTTAAATTSSSSSNTSSTSPASSEHKIIPDPDERTHLHLACFFKYTEIAQLLLDSGHAVVNGRDTDWTSPLHRACYSNAFEIVKLLLNRNADPQLRDREWLSPLHICAANDAFECLELLIQAGVSVDVVDKNGASALHHAANSGHLRTAVYLLERGADAKLRDNGGRQPLHYAAANGDADIIHLLIPYVNNLDVPDSDGHTPVMIAASSNEPAALKTLLDAGARLDVQDKAGYTALHHACERGNAQVVQQLLSLNAPLHLRTRTGLSPLHLCCSSSVGGLVLKELAQHLDRLPIDNTDQYQRTPLHMATKCGVLSHVLDLLLMGANPNATDILGRTPLHYAAQMRHFDIVVELITSRTVQVNIQDKTGMTALHYAASNGDQDIISILLKNGADCSLKDSKGRTPHFLCAHSPVLLQLLGKNLVNVDKDGRNLLHFSAFSGDRRAVDYLLKELPKVEIHRKDTFGRTPLHYFCSQDDSGYAVKALLKAGADPLALCNQQMQPIHYAAGHGRKGALLALLSRTEISWPMLQYTHSPAALAASQGSVEALQVLLEAGVCDNIGRCIELATMQGHADCIQLLLRLLMANQFAGLTRPNCFTNYANVSMEQLLCPALHVAALQAQTHCFRVLLQAINRLDNVQDSLGRTPLMLASLRCRHNYECIDTLLKREAKVQTRDFSGRSVIFYAVFSGHEEAVRHFLHLGVNCTQENNRGKTPLHLAAALGYADILSSLIRFGGFGRCSEITSPSDSDPSEITSRQTTPDQQMDTGEGQTVVDETVTETTDEQTLKGEQEREDKVEEGEEKTPETVSTNEEQKMSSSEMEPEKQAATPDSDKMCSVSPECSDSFVGNQSSRNLFSLLDSEGFDPLHWAAYCGRINTLTVLLENSSREYSPRPRHGITPLHLACFKGNLACVKLLVQHFGQEMVTMPDSLGRQVLHYLAMGNEFTTTTTTTTTNNSVFSYLLTVNCSLDAVDYQNQTPLMYAIQRGDAGLCDQLLDAGANVLIEDSNQNLALHLACLHSLEQVAIRLAALQPNTVNHLNGEANNPLHLSASNGLIDLTNDLLANDANVFARNKNRQTPSLVCAKSADVAECLDLIEAIMLYEERKDLESMLEAERRKSGQLHFSSPLSNTTRRSLMERRSRNFLSPNSGGRRSHISFNVDCSDISLFKVNSRVNLEPENSSTPTEKPDLSEKVFEDTSRPSD